MPAQISNSNALLVVFVLGCGPMSWMKSKKSRYFQIVAADTYGTYLLYRFFNDYAIVAVIIYSPAILEVV